MTNLKDIEAIIVDGLQNHLKERTGKNITVVMANQTGRIPGYPYVSYTITTPIDANAKTWCRASDGSFFRQLTQVWSFTVQSDEIDTADNVMQYCFEWFDVLGNRYFSENNVSVERILNVGNRDNLITIEYEYRRGFDVRVSYMHIIGADTAQNGTEIIETAEFTPNFKEV